MSYMQIMINILFDQQLICINFNPDITDAGAGIIETSHDYEMFPRVLQIPARFWQRNKQFLVQENTSNGDDTLDNHNFVMLQKASILLQVATILLAL